MYPEALVVQVAAVAIARKLHKTKPKIGSVDIRDHAAVTVNRYDILLDTIRACPCRTPTPAGTVINPKSRSRSVRDDVSRYQVAPTAVDTDRRDIAREGISLDAQPARLPIRIDRPADRRRLFPGVLISGRPERPIDPVHAGFAWILPHPQ